MRGLSLIVGLAGIWQIVAPYLLRFSSQAVPTRNAIICGVLLLIFGALSLYGVGTLSPRTVSIFDWLAFLTGLWLLVSPFVLRYREVAPAFWSAVIAGLISLICAAFLGAHTYSTGSDTAVTT